MDTGTVFLSAYLPLDATKNISVCLSLHTENCQEKERVGALVHVQRKSDGNKKHWTGFHVKFKKPSKQSRNVQLFLRYNVTSRSIIM